MDMMIKDFEGISPTIDSKTFVADGTQVIGAVTMKEYSSLWFNTVARGDVNRIEIGRYSNVQDNSVVHVADDYPTIIGDFVTIGHNAVIHGCTIEDHCLIGMGGDCAQWCGCWPGEYYCRRRSCAGKTGNTATFPSSRCAR